MHILIARTGPVGRPGPRCPHCGDWAVTAYGPPGVPLVCPSCGLWVRLVLDRDGQLTTRATRASVRVWGKG
jgi:hypothetical protein